jgi:hypothetical protein
MEESFFLAITLFQDISVENINENRIRKNLKTQEPQFTDLSEETE